MCARFFPPRRTTAVLATALWVALVPAVRAHVDDAHSMAMEIATPHVAKGFVVRQDYWKGEVKSGETKQIKAQLFKGNEYWFWLGCDADECELELKVLDQKGTAVAAETKKAKNAIAVRVLPAKTGSFTFVFTIKSTRSEKASWALAYGYR
jgi:hypothetical protein